MTTRRWSDLDRRQRRREVTSTALSVAVTWALLVGIYYLLPFADLSSRESLVRLVVGIIGFTILLVWQLRAVTGADLPALRAVQALGALIPLFLIAFAIVYLSFSQASSENFSETLDHTGALYFTVTIFSTVGFGDITPESELAQIVVSAQMLLDLVVIGTVVRLLTTAAQTGRGDATRAASTSAGAHPAPAP